METTLSRFLPEDSFYFYGYPAGDASRFFNLVPPDIEELVSARPLVCAGRTVNIIAFAATTRSDALNVLRDLGVPIIADAQIYRLPEKITKERSGCKRNELIRRALRSAVPANTLIMAQPYAEQELADLYQMQADLCIRLNDKRTMSKYIPAQYLPQTIALYGNGAAFSAEERALAPCVVKVASSSSGDGVRVCRTPQEWTSAQASFITVTGDILVQEYIAARENIGVQFAIPVMKDQPPVVLGFSRQITSEDGEFCGGMLTDDHLVSQTLSTILTKDILPAIRNMGWYGAGGFDVLMTESGQPYFIDPNFRMTAMTAFIYEYLNGIARRNMVTMTGTFTGSVRELRRIARMGTNDQQLNIVSLLQTDDGFLFNGAVLFDQKETLVENAQALLRAGVRSTVLTLIANNRFPASP